MSLRLYETVFIARQDITGQQVESITQKYIDIIKESGGEVSKTEFCGLRQLAYRIKKNKKGHYVLMNIASNPEAVHEMERLLRLNEDVLRYMTLCVDEHDNNPSLLMQQRSFREDRTPRPKPTSSSESQPVDRAVSARGQRPAPSEEGTTSQSDAE